MRTLTTDLASLATHGGPTVWKCLISALYVLGIFDLASCALSSMRIGLKQEALIMCSTPDPIVPHYVVWHKGHQSVKLLGPRFYVNPKSGSLTISSVQLEDEGNFTCSAGYGDRFEPFTVTMVVSIPPAIRVTSSNPVLPHVGGKLTLICQATGKPLPSVMWYTSKQAAIDEALTEAGSRFSIQVKQPKDTVMESHLVIFPVFAEDQGSFACIATNNVGSSHDSAVVDVQRKPVMLSPDQDILVYWWEGHKTNLTCQSVGNPAPVLGWSSVEDSSGGTPQLALSPIVRVKNGVVVSSTIWLPVKQTFHLPAMFECRAENIYGVTPKRRFEVKVGYAPLAPILYVLSIKDDEIVLSISNPWQEDTPPIIYVIARYRLEESFREMEASTSFLGNGTKFALRGIMLSYRYVIKIKAVNTVGESEATVLNIYSEERTFTVPTTATVSPAMATGTTGTDSQENHTNAGSQENDNNSDDNGDNNSNGGTDTPHGPEQNETNGNDDGGRTLQSQGGNNSSKLSPKKWIIAVIFLWPSTLYLFHFK